MSNNPNNDRHDTKGLWPTLLVVLFILLAFCYIAVRNVQQWQGMA